MKEGREVQGEELVLLLLFAEPESVGFEFSDVETLETWTVSLAAR
jgi:hypothetical protein